MKKRQLFFGIIFGAMLVLLFAVPSMAASGVVNVTSPGTASFPLFGYNAVPITLTEGSTGSFVQYSSTSITLTLPTGFVWGGYPSTTTSVYGQYSFSFNTTNNGKTFNICPNSIAPLAQADIVNLPLSVILADQLLAQSGDVICQVGGVSNVSATTLKLGTYTAPVNVVNPNILVTSSNCPTIMSGKVAQASGNITISENSAGQLVNGGTINFILPEGARWNINTMPWITSVSGNAIIGPRTILPNHPNIFQACVVTAPTPSASSFLIAGAIDLSADFSGDLNITVNGSAGASGAVKVATVVPPVTAALAAGSVPATILCGVQGQALPDITITENMAGAIGPQMMGNNTIYVDFPAGMIPSFPTVQVTAGDLIIAPSSISRMFFNDHYRYSIVAANPSTQPSGITLSNIKVSVDQNVLLGPLKLEVKGPAVVDTDSVPYYYFPGATVAASVTAGQVYSTAPAINNGISVSGQVQLENSYESGVTVSLFNAATASSIMQVFTDASGNYQFLNVSPGTYNVVAKHKGFLKATASSITVSTTAVTVPALTMKAGDLNGDNIIDLLDIATFAKNYGSAGN